MARKRVMWRGKIPDLDELFDRIYHGNSRTTSYLFEQLESIFGEGEKIRGTDNRVLEFVEFLFFRAGGPYSDEFQKVVEVIKTVLELHPPIKSLLNSSADHAIANMVLNGRGNLKFRICDRYELIKVLKSWQFMGLRRITQRAVFNAIMNKSSTRKRLSRPDFYLIARLESIFPQWRKEINPHKINVKKILFEIHRSRFESIVEEKLSSGIPIQELIEIENIRNLPAGIRRNALLSYLIKKKHDFKCQLRKNLPCTHNPYTVQEVQSHHIVPLHQGGDDHSSNIIVLCNYHHELVHQNKLKIALLDNMSRIKIEYKGKIFNFKAN